jgi:hypothetical protein
MIRRLVGLALVGLLTSGCAPLLLVGSGLLGGVGLWRSESQRHELQELRERLDRLTPPALLQPDTEAVVER